MKKKVIKKITEKKSVNSILKENNQGVKLDIGCGGNKQRGFVGMDVRKMEGVDIVHNLEKFPWPIPNESVSLAVASHVLEHINPGSTDPRLVALVNLLDKKKVLSKKEIKNAIGEVETFGVFMSFMNEVWRILQKGGRFAFVVPYAGSPGFFQDPTHINPISEATISYFDPLDRSGLWFIYRPSPWKIIESHFDTIGNLEVVLEKRLVDKSYEPISNEK